MEPQKFKELLDRYARNECNADEVEYIHRWYDSIGESGTGSWRDDADDLVKSRVWSRIRPVQQKRETGFVFPRVAAAVLMLSMAGAAAFFYFRDSGNPSASRPAAEKTSAPRLITNALSADKTVVLDDGTEVTLHPGSELRIAGNFRRQTREVYLTGEAFFRVKRDERKPFVVYANEVVTRVLGTSFLVRAYKNDKEVTVTVKTGKVSVYALLSDSSDAPSGREVILTPNQQIIYDRKREQLSRRLVPDPEVILPIPTLFRMQYDGAPVTEILEVLEENYGVDIQYDGQALAGCVLTTSMAEEGLFERIEVICRAINAAYTIEDTAIVIDSRGCK